jgi:hypothetical protein
MALGDQTTAGINYNFSTISEIISIDGFTSLTNWTEPESLIGNKLVGSKAIVEFTDIDI